MDELAERVVEYHNKLEEKGIKGELLRDLVRDWQQGIMDIERERIVARASADTDAIARIVREEIGRVAGIRR